MPKKCIAVHLPVDLLDKINEQKAKTGQSQNAFIIDLIEKGLGFSTTDNVIAEKFFFVKVRIDPAKMMEFGQKLQNGEIDTSHTIMTYCPENDPTVGLSFWHAGSQESFEKVFDQHRVYYKDVIEVVPVITPMDSMKLILENIKKQ